MEPHYLESMRFMGYPRYLLVDSQAAGTYHCVSRCVRRAFLCGFDRLSGRSFEHRKRWVEERLLTLSRFFAVDVLAFAVMSNHLHVVVHVDPRTPHEWSAEETARRWLSLFRPRGLDEQGFEQRVELLSRDDVRIGVIRGRLGSLSWFMRCLNEPIARRANDEDDCTGRFWEGRFRCQALLDEAAILACMVYVDLNPLRAGTTRSCDGGPYTSARVRRRRRGPAYRHRGRALPAVAGSLGTSFLPIDESAYFELLRWSGATLHPRRSGVSPRRPPAALAVIGLPPANWCSRVESTETRFFRAIGSATALRKKAADMGQRWLCGIGFAQIAVAGVGTA